MNILFLSGYEAASHKYWAQTLIESFPDINWTYLALPPRHFSWRVRGSSYSLVNQYPKEMSERYDLVVATSMVDVSGIKSMCPNLSMTPWHLYFHENQFAYPDRNQRDSLVDIQLTTVYSALSCDRLFFNSNYNLASFQKGALGLFKRFPDFNHLPAIEALSRKSVILPVPIEVTIQQSGVKELGDVVWNHRWEFDKGPERLFEFVVQFCQLKQPGRLHIVGQRFRKMPDIFLKMEAILSEAGKLGCFGYVEDRAEYLRLLSCSEFVLSTSEHDFQGLSILEACALGAKPLVPNRLVYPEWFGSNCYVESSNYTHEAGHAMELYCSGGEAVNVNNLSRAKLLPRYELELLTPS